MFAILFMALLLVIVACESRRTNYQPYSYRTSYRDRGTGETIEPYLLRSAIEEIGIDRVNEDPELFQFINDLAATLGV